MMLRSAYPQLNMAIAPDTPSARGRSEVEFDLVLAPFQEVSLTKSSVEFRLKRTYTPLSSSQLQ